MSDIGDDSPVVDKDCGLGAARALTYVTFEGGRIAPFAQPVECCAYPGKGKAWSLVYPYERNRLEHPDTPQF